MIICMRLKCINCGKNDMNSNYIMISELVNINSSYDGDVICMECNNKL